MGNALTDVGRTVPNPRTAPAQAKAAIVRSTPDTASDDLQVELTGQAGVKRSAIGWAPRYTVDGGDATEVLPTDGDRCVVIDADDKTLWVLAWWPDA